MASIFDRNKKEEVNPLRLLYEFKQQYRNVFLEEVNGEMFIFRSLGRLEYRRIIEDKSLENFEKEDYICKTCLLYPQDYDFENCAAGTPMNLTKKILEFSFLDSLEIRDAIMSYYRAEMFDLENQITCLIHEAFPEFDIEDIEKWDVEKTSKYAANAEWILMNLRGVNMTGFSFQEIANKNKEPKKEPIKKEKAALRDKEVDVSKVVTEEITTKQEPKKTEPKAPSVNYSELEEAKRKFPGIDWSALVTPEMAFSDTDTFIGMDTRPPALRDKSVKI